MRSDLESYWRDPGYWRWVWRTHIANARLSAETKSCIALFVAVACAIVGYLSAGWLAPTDEKALVTTLRAVTVVRTVPAKAAPAVPPPRPAHPAHVQLNILSITPPRPQAGRRFEVVARAIFAPVAGSMRCGVSLGRKPYRNIRLTWESPIARCFFRVPDAAHGETLQIRLSAVLDKATARTMLRFKVA
jgi:hypothetical protein